VAPRNGDDGPEQGDDDRHRDQDEEGPGERESPATDAGGLDAFGPADHAASLRAAALLDTLDDPLFAEA